MICVLSLFFITVSLVSLSMSAFICQPAPNPVSQSVSQMSQCLSCHGSAHKCLFVSLSSLQTQVLHRPVNGFVRWPFHRASHEDRQGTAISPCVHLRVCVYMCMFQSQAARLGSGNKRPPKYPPESCISKIPVSGFSVRQQSSRSNVSLSVTQPAVIQNHLYDTFFYRKIKNCQNPGKFIEQNRIL